ncbi:MAG: hypothetical protein ACPGU6_00875 [Tenacibaculum sp.]
MSLSHLILGFLTSYLGFAAPSMLNITASKIYLENNIKIARQYIVGVSFMVFFQVLIAIEIFKVINKHPQLISQIEKIATIVFAVLSIVFIRKGMLSKKQNKSKSIHNGFLFGLSLSFVNMFAVPFFTIACSYLVMNGWKMTSNTQTSLFIAGTVLGVFTILNNYVFLAKKVKSKLLLYTKYFNFLIGIITGVMAVYTAVKVYF